jgi:pimeloyl-ACP methyl ester carboxylesterase
MMNKLVRSLAVWVGSIAALSAAPATVAAQPDDVVCVDAQIRGGIEEVCNAVYENPNAPFGITVMTVHGFTRTAAAWETFADALFADPAYGSVVKNVVAIDLPGRGDTPATPGPYGDGASVFGTLLINDYVGIVIDDIVGLRAAGIEPRTLIGHSMGGLQVQAVQEALLAQGSSLADLGISRAILLAPVPNGNATWHAGGTGGDVTPYLFGITQPPFEFGPFFDFPPPVGLLGGAFTRLDGTLATNLPPEWLAPIPELLPEYVPTGIPAEWMGWEPLFVTQQLVGTNPSLPPRPGARDGAFAQSNGTRLTLISFSQDVLTPTIDHPGLYEQLLGKKSGPGFQLVDNENAVHESFVVTPETVIAAIKNAPSAL